MHRDGIPLVKSHKKFSRAAPGARETRKERHGNLWILITTHVEAFDSFKPQCRLFCLTTYQLKTQISSQISNGYDSSPQKPLEDRMIARKKEV